MIGITISYSDGEALEVAGPSGTLLASAVMGIAAIFVMEGISEMTQSCPTPNATTDFVRVFVDGDRAWASRGVSLMGRIVYSLMCCEVYLHERAWLVGRRCG